MSQHDYGVSIYMRFYIGDFLKETTVMSAEQVGFYTRLLLHYWQNECIPLEDDDDILARICAVTKAHFKKNKKVVMKHFTQNSDGWSHSRIESNYADAVEQLARLRIH